MARARLLHRWVLFICVGLLLAGWRELPENDDPDPPIPVDACRQGKCLEKPPATYRSEPVQPQTAQDRYGYISDDSYTTNSWDDAWTEASTDPDAIQVFFGSIDDDDKSETVELPFIFPFYEQAYPQVRISSNGLIGFDASLDQNYASYAHYPIPHDYIPQAIIAPFWTDLDYVSAFYMDGTDGRGRFFVVEWFECTHYSQSTAVLTFEVKLYENGDIVFLYNELTDVPPEKSIGIEDPHGVDGLPYLYNSAGPNEGKAILISRPAEGRRTKIVPAYQSGLNVNRVSEFQVSIWNTGNLQPDPADTFGIECIPSDPSWEVELFQEGSPNPLSDCTTTPFPETGELASGEAFTLTVKVRAPEEVSVGEVISVTLEATSRNDETKESSSLIVSAVPTSFTHTYRNVKLVQDAGVNIELISPRYRWDMLVNNDYTGASFALGGMLENRVMGMWENNVGSSTTNLDYMSLDSIGARQFDSVQHLTENASYKRDQFPALALSLNGRIGITWVRKEINSLTGYYKQNVYFAILSENASQLVGPIINVTDDSSNYPPTQLFVHKEVRIAATRDNNFHLSWIKSTTQDSITTEEIFHSVYNSSGDVIKGPQMITIPTQGVDNYGSSLLAFKVGDLDRVLLFGQRRENPDNPSYKLVYYLLTSSGTVLGSQEEFYPQKGTDLDGIQLQNEKIAIAWINLDTEQVNYVVFDPTLFFPPSPNVLANPDDWVGHRAAGRISVTRDLAGRAILTWMDESFKQRLYYALINDNGVSGLVTQPVYLHQLVSGIETTVETRALYGNTEYRPVWRLEIPILKK